MSRRLMIATAISSTLGIWLCQSAAVADSVPSWDVTASCRGAAQAGYQQDSKENLKRCLDTEQRAREQLEKKLVDFPGGGSNKMR
jgi:hypothetical protein